MLAVRSRTLSTDARDTRFPRQRSAWEGGSVATNGPRDMYAHVEAAEAEVAAAAAALKNHTTPLVSAHTVAVRVFKRRFAPIIKHPERITGPSESVCTAREHRRQG